MKSQVQASREELNKLVGAKRAANAGDWRKLSDAIAPFVKAPSEKKYQMAQIGVIKALSSTQEGRRSLQEVSRNQKGS